LINIQDIFMEIEIRLISMLIEVGDISTWINNQDIFVEIEIGVSHIRNDKYPNTYQHE
jgi:hypothetical protein